MTHGWGPTAQGILVLPSGRVVRGRALREPVPAALSPEFGLYLLGHEPEPMSWPSRWLQWRDFWLPSDRGAARDALTDLWRRAAEQRVEVACGGGRGRTGTALACLAVLDGVSADQAIAFVRQHYHKRAVETIWQRWYVARFNAR